jgi:predicted dehydrogenase
MTNRVKCAVIGAGWWATYAHVPALKACAHADLVAIQNDDAAQAQRTAHDFGVPHFYTSAEALLAADNLQAVVISSSPNLHYQQAAAALAAGKHVLIEKPMTLHADEAWHLVAMAEARRLQLLISCPWHYTRHAAAARELIRTGALGQLRMISVLMTNPISHLLRGESTAPTHGTPYTHPRIATYADPAIAGGGQVYAQMPHIIAYLVFLTGSRAEEVFARFHNDGARLDIYDTLNLRMDDNTIVSIASTAATDRDHRRFEVRLFGAAGILLLELWNGTMQWISTDGAEHNYPPLAEHEIYPQAAPAIDLIESIREDRPNRSPGTLGAAAMDVVVAACASAASGKNISVKQAVEVAR